MYTSNHLRQASLFLMILVCHISVGYTQSSLKHHKLASLGNNPNEVNTYCSLATSGLPVYDFNLDVVSPLSVGKVIEVTDTEFNTISYYKVTYSTFLQSSNALEVFGDITNLDVCSGNSTAVDPTVSLSNENYVFSRVYKNRFTTPLTNPSTTNAIEEITYFDGLGRPMQHIGIRQAATTKEDIVTHMDYDAFGREDKKYLPYPDASSPGGLKTGDVILKTQNYYSLTFSGDFTTSVINPYSETSFEASPLNRSLEQGAPGSSWAVNKTSDTDYTVKFDYSTNEGPTATGKVRMFKVNLSANFTPTLTNPSPYYYAAGELYKTVTKDENWVAGTTNDTLNNIVEEFKDKQGRVVLKRTYNAGTAHDTYYVYDDYGNLTYVIPPKADGSTTTVAGNTTKLNELCYQYKYDNRNRLIEKKIPGKGWEYIVYNKLDQPILTQDAVQRSKTSKEWLFTKYDAFGRVISTGIYLHNAIDQPAMQKVVDDYYVANITRKVWEEKPGINLVYSNQSYPTTNIEVLTLNYYDNYNFDHVNLKLASGTVIFDDNVEYTTKGLATGSKVKVLDQAKWITTVNHYNKEGRVIYTASYNDFLITTDKVKNQLDFMGVVLKTESSHKKGTNAEIITTDNFTYDHVNRLVKHTQILNGKTEVIAANIYDKLGQLKSKEVGNEEGRSRLQTVDYNYNIRGWLTGINNTGGSNSTIGLGTNDLFGFQINYNKPTDFTKALFNGNISQTLWKSKSADQTQRSYLYLYDDLNRLTRAISNDGKFDVGSSTIPITYDKSGNIQKIYRKGAIVASPVYSTTSHFGVMDYMTYTYDSGNKLKAVNDIGNTSYGFKDASTLTTQYTYDVNGNMLIDSNKGITAIVYNHLNLPKSVSIGGGTITYIYDATGVKQRKVAGTTTTDYAGNYMYKNNVLQFFNHPEGYVDNNAGTYKYHYQYKDHLGNIRLSYFNNGTALSPSVVISEENNYYPFGLEHKGYNNLVNGSEHPYKYNGKEHNEELGLDWYDFGARNYDAALGRWMNIDPLAEQMRRHSPYNYAFNNPVFFIDPDGKAPEDFVLGQNGNIYWDDNANSQATTQAGDTYLGKELTFTFNSNIDGELWDGPGGDAPVGDKLTSTVTLSASENSDGQLTGISASKDVQIGSTPIGAARDYFPGLGDDQNKFSASQSTNSDGTLSSFSLNFEQHASVSPIEGFGLDLMGYDIVNVAQKLNVSTSGSELSVSASTDVFPSASLSVNGNQLFRYDQPSFRATHGRSRSFSDNGRGSVNVISTPRRPAPSFHLRYKN